MFATHQARRLSYLIKLFFQYLINFCKVEALKLSWYIGRKWFHNFDSGKELDLEREVLLVLKENIFPEYRKKSFWKLQQFQHFTQLIHLLRLLIEEDWHYANLEFKVNIKTLIRNPSFSFWAFRIYYIKHVEYKRNRFYRIM